MNGSQRRLRCGCTVLHHVTVSTSGAADIATSGGL